MVASTGLSEIRLSAPPPPWLLQGVLYAQGKWLEKIGLAEAEVSFEGGFYTKKNQTKKKKRN